jgi:hypothetical protein
VFARLSNSRELKILGKEREREVSPNVICYQIGTLINLKLKISSLPAYCVNQI